MKQLSVFFCAVLLAGCTGTHREGIALYDQFDAIKVDEMVGNNVSGKVLQRTILCLNARRETRLVTSVTNVQVVFATNLSVSPVTNMTISLSTNSLVTTMTNLAPLVTPPVILAEKTAEGSENNALVVVTNPPPSLTTNVTISLANNASATTAPNQTAAINQAVRSYNNQITTTSNNLTVSLMTNVVVTGETNLVINFVTNYSLASVTNVTIVPTNLTVRDYFLYTELTPPPDFNPAGGENLFLLVDGVRYSFAPSQPAAAVSARKGYTDAFYRVPPELLVAIANSKEVQVRLRGTATTIDREMSASSRRNFKEFMLKYFKTQPQPPALQARMASVATEPRPADGSASSDRKSVQ